MMSLKNTFSSALVAAGTLLFAGINAQAQDVVNVVCVTEDWCQALKEPFLKATGTRVEFLNLRTNESLVRIRAEASNPTLDVFYGGTGDPHFVAAGEKLTVPYETSRMSELSTDMVKAVKGAYLPLYANPIALVINPAVLKEAGAPTPASWKDLADPRFKGLIGMADPNSSGTAYTIIATLVQIYGEEEAFKLLGSLPETAAQRRFLVSKKAKNITSRT